MKLIVGAWLCDKHVKELMQSGLELIDKTPAPDIGIFRCKEQNCSDEAHVYLNFIVEIEPKEKKET